MLKDLTSKKKYRRTTAEQRKQEEASSRRWVVVHDFMPLGANKKRFQRSTRPAPGRTVKLSDRIYQVQKDGSIRRVG